MKTFALGCSASPNSINYKGLTLLDHWCKFDKLDSLSNYNIPVINTSAPDGITPKDVTTLIDIMHDYNKFVFAVPEMTEQMGTAFKNFLDWLVTKYYQNWSLGKSYPFSKCATILLTFTTSGEEGGSRHFPQTIKILNKLGANVVHSKCFNDSWEHVIPNNYEHFKSEAKIISNYINISDKTQAGVQTTYSTWLNLWKK